LNVFAYTLIRKNEKYFVFFKVVVNIVLGIWKSLGKFVVFFLAITFEPETLESLSRAPKMWIIV